MEIFFLTWKLLNYSFHSILNIWISFFHHSIRNSFTIRERVQFKHKCVSIFLNNWHLNIFREHVTWNLVMWIEMSWAYSAFDSINSLVGRKWRIFFYQVSNPLALYFCVVMHMTLALNAFQYRNILTISFSSFIYDPWTWTSLYTVVIDVYTFVKAYGIIGYLQRTYKAPFIHSHAMQKPFSLATYIFFPFIAHSLYEWNCYIENNNHPINPFRSLKFRFCVDIFSFDRVNVFVSLQSLKCHVWFSL